MGRDQRTMTVLVVTPFRAAIGYHRGGSAAQCVNGFLLPSNHGSSTDLGWDESAKPGTHPLRAMCLFTPLLTDRSGNVSIQMVASSSKFHCPNKVLQRKGTALASSRHPR